MNNPGIVSVFQSENTIALKSPQQACHLLAALVVQIKCSEISAMVTLSV